MTDAELTRLAAKAFGCATEGFSPLTDDGDALRLAVKLQMPVFSFAGGSRVVYGFDNKGEFVRETNTGDPYAATRRCIVRAAAAIGEKM